MDEEKIHQLRNRRTELKEWLTYGIGIFAQLLFSGRSILQWLLSEKHKKVLTPSLFWQLSLLASFLLFTYGYLRNDLAIMIGQVMTYFIYIRNLHLQGQWYRFPKVVRIFILLFPGIIIVFSFNNNVYDIDRLLRQTDIPNWLMIFGIIAQVVFTLRFIFQWLYSERNRKSSLPLGFWVLSLIGSIMILCYAVFRSDPVLFVGHLFGTIMYSRNILLLKSQSADE